MQPDTEHRYRVIIGHTNDAFGVMSVLSRLNEFLLANGADRQIVYQDTVIDGEAVCIDERYLGEDVYNLLEEYIGHRSV